jgi:DNA-binding transcriptional MerR regulator
MATPLPDKKFFKIGEVASLVGVKTHVLRYWESELGSIRPLKTRGAHRMYRREDVATFCTVRALLHDEGLTLAAVKRRLAGAGAERASETVSEGEGAAAIGPSHTEPRAAVVSGSVLPSVAQARGDAERALALRAELIQVRGELQDLLSELDRPHERPEREAAATATVTAVVPKTVLIQRTIDATRTR